MQIIDRATLEQTLSLDDALHSQRQAFAALQRGEVQQALRSRFDWPAIGARTLVMPAMQAGNPLLCIKIVQVNDGGAVNGQIWVMDTRTQTPVAILDAEFITLLRTAATSTLSALHLAPANVDTVTFFGAGHQVAAHLRAFVHAGIGQRFRICGRNPARIAEFARDMHTAHGVDVHAVVDPQVAIRDAQVVCTCTPATAPLFDARALADDVHVIAIGAFRPDMCELPAEAFQKAFVCVDQLQAAKSEAGDLLAAARVGNLQWDAVQELGAVLTRSRAERPARRTVFKSLGLAVQDQALACLALQRLGVFRG